MKEINIMLCVICSALVCSPVMRYTVSISALDVICYVRRGVL